MQDVSVRGPSSAGRGEGAQNKTCIDDLYICDPLRENPALRTNIEFELEAILSVQVVSHLNSDYTTCHGGLALYHVSC